MEDIYHLENEELEEEWKDELEKGLAEIWKEELKEELKEKKEETILNTLKRTLKNNLHDINHKQLLNILSKRGIVELYTYIYPSLDDLLNFIINNKISPDLAGKILHSKEPDIEKLAYFLYNNINKGKIIKKISHNLHIPIYRRKEEIQKDIEEGKISKFAGKILLKKYTIDLNYKQCSANTNIDIFSLENWSNKYRPEIFIRIIRDLDKNNIEIQCYRKDELLKYIKDNKFSAWYPIRGYRIGDDGENAYPFSEEIVYKFPLYIFVYNDIKSLKKLINNNPILDAYRIFTNKRIGNKRGDIIVSGLHGQAPGQDIYFLVNPRKNVIKQIYNMALWYYNIKDIDSKELANLNSIKEIIDKLQDIKNILNDEESDEESE